MTEPRILVTGFNAFPGAPLNSTEVLIGELAARVAELAGTTAEKVRLVIEI